MKIVQIKKSKTKNMLDLYFSDNSIMSVYEEDYYRMNLYEKKEFTEGDILDLKDITDEKSARIYAIKLILYKKRTKKEIESKLIEKDISMDIINRVIQKLEADGYINDVLYAERLIQKLRQKNKSKKQVELELKLKGLDYLEDILDTYECDEVIAGELFKKKFSGKDLKDEKTKFKVYNFFRSKGFSNEVIKKFLLLDK